ncbi:transmembrane protein 51-like [Polypterus senegalus]
MAQSSNSSGSQYALSALGIGLIALGIVMIVWTMAPGNSITMGNSSKPDSGTDVTKGKTTSIAFVLLGAGVVMLLLAICLTVRNKRTQRRREATPPNSHYDDNRAPQTAGRVEELPRAVYDVPSYEEVVGSAEYPVRQSNLPAASLPSYESLVDADAVLTAMPAASATDAPVVTQTTQQQLPPQQQSGPQNQRPSRRLRPLKIRRIMSEKLHLKDIRLNVETHNQNKLVSIEPLTPPPQYDDTIMDKIPGPSV